MAYQKRVYTDTTEEVVTYEDMNRIETGIEANDIRITELDETTAAHTTKLTELDNKNTEQDAAIGNKVNNSTFTAAKTALETAIAGKVLMNGAETNVNFIRNEIVQDGLIDSFDFSSLTGTLGNSLSIYDCKIENGWLKTEPKNSTLAKCKLPVLNPLGRFTVGFKYFLYRFTGSYDNMWKILFQTRVGKDFVFVRTSDTGRIIFCYGNIDTGYKTFEKVVDNAIQEYCIVVSSEACYVNNEKINNPTSLTVLESYIGVDGETTLGSSYYHTGFEGEYDYCFMYNRILTPQEIQHNFSVLNNPTSIKSIETTDSSSVKTSFLIGTKTDLIETRTGHTEEERYTALLSKFGKKFTSDGSDITVENGIENQRVLSTVIKGQTVKNVLQTEEVLLQGDAIKKYSTIKHTSNDQLKQNTTYTYGIEVLENTLVNEFRALYVLSTSCIADTLTIPSKSTGVFLKLVTSKPDFTGLDGLIQSSTSDNETGYIKFRRFLVEGDYTNKIKSYIPFGLTSTQAIISNNNLKYSFYKDATDKASGTVITLGGVGGVYNTWTINRDGSGIYTQNVYRTTFNGNTTGVYNASGTSTYLTDCYMFDLNLPLNATNNYTNGIPCISGEFLCVPLADRNSNKELMAIFATNQVRLVIKSSKLTEPTIGELKTYLTTNPITFEYVLATPIVTYIPKELVQAILTQATNEFKFGDAVKPSGVEITVPVDKVGDLEKRLQVVEAVMTSTSNLALSVNYVEDEYTKNNLLEEELL